MGNAYVNRLQRKELPRQERNWPISATRFAIFAARSIIPGLTFLLPARRSQKAFAGS